MKVLNLCLYCGFETEDERAICGATVWSAIRCLVRERWRDLCRMHFVNFSAHFNIDFTGEDRYYMHVFGFAVRTPRWVHDRLLDLCIWWGR